MEHGGSEEYPVITLEGRGEVIQGDIVFLSYDSLAVRLKAPVRGGCVRMKIHPPYDNGYLVDDDGYINQRGQEMAAETLLDLHRAARHLDTIRDELVRVITEVRSSSSDATESVSSIVVKAFDLLGPHVGDVNLPTFCSTVETWIEEGHLKHVGADAVL